MTMFLIYLLLSVVANVMRVESMRQNRAEEAKQERAQRNQQRR